MPSLRSAATALSCFFAFAATAARGQVAVNLVGTVTDSAGTTPLPGAACKLEVLGISATSGSDGAFTLNPGTGLHAITLPGAFADVRESSLLLEIPSSTEVGIRSVTGDGRSLLSRRLRLEAGSHRIPLQGSGSGARWIQVESGTDQAMLRLVSVDGSLYGTSTASVRSRAWLGKASAAALYDVLSCTKDGYQKAYVTIARSDSAGIKVRMLKTATPKFSFFVTSMKALQDLAGPNGFGGDLRFGETGPGAGLRGADKICATIAERSMPGSSVKGWRAFLSVSSDTYGKRMDAINRVGPGPWYDRVGRMVAPAKADLLGVRPKNGDPTIQVDLPNENGIPNHKPDPSKPAVDNHHTVTGSNANGLLQSSSSTCKDWTTSNGASSNGHPACGFSWPRPGGGTGPYAGQNWMTSYDAPGCGAKMEVSGDPPVAPPEATGIGDGGGYGGFYCFALNP
jgi:hypothetical protein